MVAVKRKKHSQKVDSNPRIGAHMSIAGGVHLSVERAKALKCRAFQIFTKNSNQWQSKEIPEEDAEEFRRRVGAGGYTHVIAHDSYLINVASPEKDLWKRSFDALLDEVERANLLGLDYLVMHPGAHKGTGEEKGLNRIADALEGILESYPDDGVEILLETTAGQGTNLGHRFEQLRYLIDRLAAGERIGICLDTAHIFAAGYDIRDRASYERTMDEFDRIIGLERLKMIHMNDTQKEFGSRVDRHHHIGKGNIGLEGFRFFMTDDRLQALPKILETPKGSDDEMDRKNLALLRKLARG
jgi:deoxyribonuclease-4